MARIGLMIEGQWGLTWERWRRLLDAAETLGYENIFRSDHFSIGSPEQASLETWVSLTYAADHTQRVQFGPLVSPTTFRHPAMTARMAAAVDDLSNGRHVLGLGTGWHEREHRQFGIPFPSMSTRYEMLEDALEITTRLFKSDTPVSYAGKHFSLEDAILLPRPARAGGPPILIGGSGMNKTLGLVALYADEWNGVFLSPADYQQRHLRLNELLDEQQRPPNAVTRSLMTQVIFAKDDAELRQKLAQEPNAETRDDIIVGTPNAIVDKIGAYTQAGVERFTLQWANLDDLDGIEAMAATVLPQL